MQTKLLFALAALTLTSCEKKETAAALETAPPAAAFDSYFTDQPIADPQAIHVARTTAMPSDEIIIHGLIMGREKVFVDGRVLTGGLKGVKGLKELSAVTVSGTVDQSSTPESLVVNAKIIHVSRP